jgi:hypothetical protein
MAAKEMIPSNTRCDVSARNPTKILRRRNFFDDCSLQRHFAERFPGNKFGGK